MEYKLITLSGSPVTMTKFENLLSEGYVIDRHTMINNMFFGIMKRDKFTDEYNYIAKKVTGNSISVPKVKDILLEINQGYEFAFRLLTTPSAVYHVFRKPKNSKSDFSYKYITITGALDTKRILELEDALNDGYEIILVDDVETNNDKIVYLLKK